MNLRVPASSLRVTVAILVSLVLLPSTAGALSAESPTSSPSGSAIPSASSDPIAPLATQFVTESEARDPLFADSIGVHTYDDRLDDYSAAGHAKRIAWLRGWRARIQAVVDAGLTDPLTAADARELLDTIDLELFENDTIRPWRTDPTLYTGVIGSAVYNLTSRTFAPESVRLANVAARLALIPALVSSAEANLSRPTEVATLQAIDENAGNIDMYAALPKTPAIRRNLPAALSALQSLQGFLKSPLLGRSDASPRVGAAVYDRELQLAEGTDESREALVKRARADFDATRAQMLAIALPLDKQMFPDAVADESKPNAVDIVVPRVLGRLADDHPTPATVFSTAKANVEAAEAFLTAHPVVVLPQPPTLKVVPTPAFMAGFAGASFDPPGPFSPLVESYFYIDEIPKTWTAAHVTSYLRDFNTYEMKMLAMHEAVPGHYVQFRYNNDTPSLVRRVYGNGSFIEGWAVYTEGMMLDSGYGDGDPRLRLFQLKWRLREQSNLIIDAGFHAEGMTEAQVRDLLVRQAFQEDAQFVNKWHRLQLSHNQLSSYYVGLDTIMRTREAARAKLGTAYDLAAYNAALLHIGSVEPRAVPALMALKLGFTN